MRAIPEDNLALAVSVSVASKPASSGFLLEKNNIIYLVTAKHVLVNKDELLYGNLVEIICQSNGLNSKAMKLQISIDNHTVKKHISSDVAIIKVGVFAKGIITFENNINIIEDSPTGVVYIKESSTKSLDKVLVSNTVYISGYPTSLGIKTMPMFDYEKPLLRKGIVAGISQKIGTIVLDCPVYPGNSGGPVIEIEQDGISFHLKTIGIIIEYLPFQEEWRNMRSGRIEYSELRNSGYSIALSIDKAFELINESNK